MMIKDKYKNWRLKRHVAKYGSKNIGYFNVFDKAWFVNHQATLIWLCNHAILKYWFRWILRIHKDIPFNERIDILQPNNYKTIIGKDKDKVTIRADFRTHNKFSKRIYYAFIVVWWAAHYWDMIFADRFVPELSFDFSVLTVYPHYDGEAGATTTDGRIVRSVTSETFATITGASSGIAVPDSIYGSMCLYGSYYSANTNEFDRLHRNFALFDTSTLGSSVTISSGTLSFYGRGEKNAMGSFEIVIVATNPASNTTLVNDDYDNISSTSLADTKTVTADWATSSYNVFTLNSDGKDNISKIGISKFGSRSDEDINGVFTGSWSANENYAVHWNSDKTGSSQDPKLVVTYSIDFNSHTIL